jgi:hypothetical protein
MSSDNNQNWLLGELCGAKGKSETDEGSKPDVQGFFELSIMTGYEGFTDPYGCQLIASPRWNRG